MKKYNFIILSALAVAAVLFGVVGANKKEAASNNASKDGADCVFVEQTSSQAAVAARALTTPQVDLAQTIETLNDLPSDWNFAIAVDRSDGGLYANGDRAIVMGRSEKDGYLHLFGVGPNDELYLLTPTGVRVRSKETFRAPDEARLGYLLSGPFGAYRVRAIVTERPVEFTYSNKSAERAQENETDLDDLALDLAPDVRDAIVKAFDGETLQDVDESTKETLRLKLKETIGGCAQAETIFSLAPQETIDSLSVRGR